MRSKARPDVRTRSIGVISRSTVRIGLIFSAVPTHACAAPIRPPRRRYSSVSTQNQMRTFCFASSAYAPSPRRGRPPPRAAAAAA